MSIRRLAARCVLVALAPITLDGCLSIGVDRYAAKSPDANARCSLEARLYEKAGDARRDVKSTREVTWKLFNLEASPVVPVKEGRGAVWSVLDLPAGKYRLAASWGPRPGVAGDTSAGSGAETMTLKPGDTARANFVLSKFPVWAWIAIGLVTIGIIIAVVAAVEFEEGVSSIGGVSSNTAPGRAPAASPASREDVAEEPATP